MTSDNVHGISPSERTGRFLDSFRKLVFQLTANRHAASAEAESRLGEVARGAGQIAGPIGFYTMGKMIYRQPTVTMGELAKELLIPPSTANRLVTWWVGNGLAERLPDPKDKRVIRVRMTEAGRRFHEITEDIAVARIGSFFSKFTPEEASIFLMLFDKLTSNFEDLPSD